MQTRLLISVIVAVVAAVPARADAQWTTPWDYTGPRGAAHWSSLAPEYGVCNTGKEQSPIDIRHTIKTDLPALRFEYKSGALRYLVNNGHTIRVNYHSPGSGDFLVVGDTRYRLTQFHFHRPSEELVHGKQYDMVLHLMHQSRDGSIVGVAVLLTAGRANPTVQRIWDHMPMLASVEHDVPGVEIDPSGMLPKTTDYYTYMGSLTAPPCTENVTWFVLKTPVEVSSAEIAKFAKLYPSDVRPPQPLNGRIVKKSR